MQTTAKSTMTVAFAGMLADMSARDVRSYVNVEGAEVPFGVCVAMVADASTNSKGTAELPDAATDKEELVGIVVHSHAYGVAELGTTGIKDASMLSVLNRGKIWVTSETTAAVGDRGHVRYAAGAGGTQLGAIRNASVVNETIDATKAIRYLTAVTSAPGLALVEVDFSVELD